MRLVFDASELSDELQAEVAVQLESIANTLVNQLIQEAPTGATSDLTRSFQIFRTSDDKIILGSKIDYADDVQYGTGPHTPDFEQIRLWSRRVLGDESAAGAVFSKIQQEGTEANPYVDRAVENTIEAFS